MKEKLLTSKVVRLVYNVIAERQVKGVDEDRILMTGIEFTVSDELAEDHIQYVINRYDNVFIYKRDKLQCIAVFPRSLNLIYNN